MEVEPTSSSTLAFTASIPKQIKIRKIPICVRTILNSSISSPPSYSTIEP